MKQLGTASEREFARRIACKGLRRLPRSVPAEDVHQAALIGLWKALKSERTDMTPEQTRCYLYRRIYGSIIDELRQMDWFSRYARNHDKPLRMCHAPIDENRFPDGSHTPEELLSDNQLAMHALVRLDPRRRAVVQEIHRGSKQCEISKWLGCSDARVSQLYRWALEDMRHILRGEAQEVSSR